MPDISENLWLIGQKLLEISGQVGLGVGQTEFAADMLAVNTDRAGGDVFSPGDVLGGQASADVLADAEFHGRQAGDVAGKVFREGGGDFLEGLFGQMDVPLVGLGQFPAEGFHQRQDDRLCSFHR